MNARTPTPRAARIAVVAAALAGVAFGTAPAGAAEADPEPEYVSVADGQGWGATPRQDPQAVRDFWTPERIAETDAAGRNPVDGEPEVPSDLLLTPGGDRQGFAPVATPYQDAESRVTGKLYFYKPLQKTTSSCSAAVVTSGSRSLVLTAAHCVSTRIAPPGTAFAYAHGNFLFVPAYRQDQAPTGPVGAFPGVQAWVPENWAADPMTESQRYDVAVIGTAPNERGQHLQDAAGSVDARLTDADEPALDGLDVRGYPGRKYGASRQFHCTARATLSFADGPQMETRNCLATPGNSGGPVFRTDTAGRTSLVGVVSQGGVSSGSATALGRLTSRTFGPLFAEADARMK
ncbi:trypsin-like serine protease [Streptomyces sp. NPDC001941]|uniref:trypsin-like serine peptidase n=1 Tax=Streptomyces sp. NPDC001941 TaxID=3154659 RepID=UPI00332F4243